MEILKREITIDNAYNVFAKKVLAIILPQMAQFVGKKIFTADGSKAKIFNLDFSSIKIDPIEGMFTQVQYCYLVAKYGKLSLKLQICCNGGSHDVKPSTAWTKYSGTEIEIGLSKDGQVVDSISTIDEVIKLHNLNKFIKLDEELVKIQMYKDLEEQLKSVKSSIQVSHELYKYL